MTLHFDPESHTYTENGKKLPSVTTIIKSAGLIDYSHVQSDVLFLASERGTKVHRATESLDWGGDPEINGIEGYIEAWKTFLTVSGSIVIQIENRVMGQINGIKYAGTFDRLIKKNDALEIIDIKTTGLESPAHPVQLWAYMYAYNQQIKDRFEHVRRYSVVYLKPDGGYKVNTVSRSIDKELHKSVFCSALNIHNYKSMA